MCGRRAAEPIFVSRRLQAVCITIVGASSEVRMYHRIACGDVDEAAAFLAALSRFLSSPAGREFGGPDVPIASFAEIVDFPPSVAVLLTAEALRAVTAAFGPPEPSSHTVVDGLPARAVPTLELNARIPRGKEEVMRALERAIATAGH